MIENIKTDIIKILKSINVSFSIGDVNVSVLTNNKFGDLTTNVAFIIGKKNKRNPYELANKIVALFNNENIKKIEIVKPGFINFFINKQSIFLIIKKIIKYGKKYGSDKKKNEKINIEFVSANPTGEIHIGHARGAAYGDVLSRVLSFSGYDVTREYYVNDAGNQIKKLGESVYYRYLEFFNKKKATLELEYKGKDIIEVARKIKRHYNDEALNKKIDFFSKFAIKEELKNIFDILSKFNVKKFDVVTHETDICKNAKIESVLNFLKSNNYIYEKDGAKFIKTALFLDDKDRVVIKKDGLFTYFFPDIIYHYNKIERGYDKLIDVLGADHHGYINRLKSALMMRGFDEKKLIVKIIQIVRFIKDKKEYKMSKRTGEMVSLKELSDEISMNSIRYFLISKNNNTHVDFDYSLARKNDNNNPVHYILYAYVRLHSVLKMAQEKKIRKNYEGNLLTTAEEKEIVKFLYDFPNIIKTVSKNYEVHLIANYVFSLAKLIHSYYNKYRIVDEKNKSLSSSRLGLIAAIKIVLENALDILGIKTVTQM
ncbi:MAG: arginine--tRNA ligase [Bacilli bacterium]|nr:arginine--tRNA ligase [Bacilli bacterium]